MTGVRAASLRVGITLHVRKGEQSLWENGIFQNCLFLAMLFQHSPVVCDVAIVVGGGDGTIEDAQRLLPDCPVPLIDLESANQSLDVIVEMSAQLSREWLDSFRAKGRKVVSMRVGNDYVIDIERMIFDKPPGYLVSGVVYDAVWTLAEYERSCVPYFRSALHSPVYVVPHLWSPVVLEKALRGLDDGLQFGYQPGNRRWKIGIFEPNICMVKTSNIPLLCCEVAHRAQSDMLDCVRAYNTFHLKDHAVFQGFMQSLDIVRHGLVGFEKRFPVWQIMATSVDAVVSHHWENAQNYLYYEALYGGYPLVHNSHLIGSCGYRYDAFDCEEGGQLLQHAFATHDSHLADYRSTANRFLHTLSPMHPDNVQAYTQRLLQVFS